MDLTLSEQKLLADFRSMTPEKQLEALDYVAFLRGKQAEAGSSLPEDVPADRCRVKTKETSAAGQSDPLITE